MAEKCPICGEKISFRSLHHDRKSGFDLIGEVQPDQVVTSCIACGHRMHTACVRESGKTVPGRHLRHFDLMVRGTIDSKRLVSTQLPICTDCYEPTIRKSLHNLEKSGNLEEAAELLEDLGRHEEANKMLARIKS